MSNIFHEIKRGFLVLGFTGPLSSGCTTAAKFFENDLNKYINKRCDKALPKIEFNIKGKYKEFNQKKNDLITESYKKQKVAKIQVHRDINKLSGGQRQKVILGRALAQEPKMLLLDEPTANLDLKHQIEVMDIIREQAKSGISVLISIHDLNLAARYCDDIIMLKNGRIYAAGGKEVLNPKNLRNVYSIRAKIIKDSGNRIIVPV